MKTTKTRWLVAAIAVAWQPIVNLQYAVSQNVGINYTGATPNSTALLDIDIGTGTARGLLIPRMTAAQRDGVLSPARGLMVFVTNDSAFYYQNGVPSAPNWVRFMAGSGNSGGWSLAGNAGTDSSTNFLGTTDLKPLRIMTNNAQAMIVSSTGNVGIGTTSPTPGKLTIWGSGHQLYATGGVLGTPGKITIDDFNRRDWTLSAGDAAANVFAIRDNAAAQYRLAIDVSGNVGIGTTAPIGVLSVVKSNLNDTLLYISNDADATKDSVLVMLQNGNVGIGTTSPVSALEVQTSAATSHALLTLDHLGGFSVGTEAQLDFRQDPDIRARIAYQLFAAGPNSHGLTFYAPDDGTNVINATPRMVIRASNVGIGTTTPGAKLEIAHAGDWPLIIGRTDADQQFRIDNVPGATPQVRFHVDIAAGIGTADMVINNNGNVGIGTTGPTSKLDVIGRASIGASHSAIAQFAVTGTHTAASGYSILQEIDGTMTATANNDVLAALYISPVYTPGAYTGVQQYGIFEGSGQKSYFTGNVGIGTTSPNLKLHIAGDLRAGTLTPAGADLTPGWGDAVVFSGGPTGIAGWDSDNSDPLWIARYNAASDVSELRIVIGDNPGSALDKLVVGNMAGIGNFSKTATWGPLFTVRSDGNVGIGTTAPGAKLEVSEGSVNARTLSVTESAGADELFIAPNLGPGGWNPLSQAGDVGIIFRDNTTIEGGSLVIGQWSASTKGIRIDSNGNVGIGTANPGGGTGSFVLSMVNAGTVPTLLAGVTHLYSSGGEGYWMDAAGNATLQTPHDHETGEWIFFSKNVKTGRVVRVNMEKLVKKIEELTGEKFMQEWQEGEEEEK